MEQIKDNLIICDRCGSDAAYKQEITDKDYIVQCLGCGFCANSLMTRDSKFLEEQLKVLPDLYKELTCESENGLIWIPNTVNQPEIGMVFANGSSGKDWKWAAVKAVPIKEEEKEKFKKKDGTYFTHRMDMSTMVQFEESNYMDALDYLGLLG